MIVSLGYIAAYVLIVGVASFAESPISQRLGAFQLNVLIRVGSLAAGAAALLAVHGLALPSGPYVLAGLGIGLVTGVGSICYCLALDSMSVSLVVTFSNLYIVGTVVLGVVVLREPVTALKVAGLAATLAGVLILAHPPGRYGVRTETGARGKAIPVRGFIIMAAYVVLVGVGAFLEKPALRGLDPTQLNAVQSLAMTVVAGVALAFAGPPLPKGKRTLAGIGVGTMIGVASVFYFVGLRDLPVSVAAASSNAYIVVTVLLSTVATRQPLTGPRGAGIALTLVGVTLLALSAG
ncbi:MAG: EamA family transporter [Candidatus Dormibacteraceae bacterium]